LRAAATGGPPAFDSKRERRNSYGPFDAKGKVNKVMHEYKEGKLKSGSGRKANSRKQAVAIAMSDIRAVEPA